MSVRMIRGWMLCVALAAPALPQTCTLTPISPAQPEMRLQEGERAIQSTSFRATPFGLSRQDIPYVFDRLNRIRRVDSSGILITVAGNGERAERVTPGPAREEALPTVGQILFSLDDVLHFTAHGQVFRLVDGRIELVAGSGRPGFNLEEGPATDVNLGSITNAAFAVDGRLLLIDGFARVRRLDADGWIRTVAGSARASVTNGLVGDEGPATQAALSSPSQVVPLMDGSFWIKDLSGRHIRLVTPDGIIDTINRSFTAAITIILMPDGEPAASFANRVVRFRPDANFQTGPLPFPAFTGTPLAVGSDGALFYQGSSRPEIDTPLVRLSVRTHTVLAAAAALPVLDGQAAPFGIWNTRTGSLLYASSVERKSGIVEARPGQAPRFVVGGGADIGEAGDKNATDLNIFGILAFSLDGQGRIIVADVFRRRILVVGTDGKTSVLKSRDGGEVIYAPTGSLSSLQRIAADNAGNIYWFIAGGTPTGEAFQAEIAVWRAATQEVTRFPVTGLSALVRRENGTVMVIAGNGANFRTAYPVTPDGLGDPHPGLRMLPLGSITEFRGVMHFTAANRLFRGVPSQVELFEHPMITTGAIFPPGFVTSSPDSLIVHRNGGFFRIDNYDACTTVLQPAIHPQGVLNAASLEFPSRIAPRQLITMRSRGFGPAEGQGTILNGLLRAAPQPAPFPALFLGNFSGTIPMSAVTGTSLPVIASNDTQVTVQAPVTAPATGSFLLYFSWNGIQFIQPDPVQVLPAAPGLFTADGSGEGLAAAINEDGSRHGPSHPARPGDLLHLYGTGFGALQRGFGLGEFFGPEEVSLSQAVEVRVADQPVRVTFAGGAAGLVGVERITIPIPDALPPGEHTVRVTVPGQEVQSARRVTIVVNY
ncbi:MAG: hypothetical protein FJW20_19745 [Acidimicrobiia bacterium]|nr:hypothetical protein [Acidimicrobiia bacterium]